jgi:hypothetical protein
LNWAATQAKAKGTLVLPDLSAKRMRRDNVRELIAWFETDGLIVADRGRLRFVDEATLFFANGGWLEQYVYATIQVLKRDNPYIQDIGRELEVSRPAANHERILNELDVAVLAQNRLHIIECKTRKFDKETEYDGIGAEAVYKLDALVNLLGGLKAKAMLVSYQPLKPNILNRARDYQILTCAYGELRNLREQLQRWLPCR